MGQSNPIPIHAYYTRDFLMWITATHAWKDHKVTNARRRRATPSWCFPLLYSSTSIPFIDASKSPSRPFLLIESKFLLWFITAQCWTRVERSTGWWYWLDGPPISANSCWDKLVNMGVIVQWDWEHALIEPCYMCVLDWITQMVFKVGSNHLVMASIATLVYPLFYWSRTELNFMRVWFVVCRNCKGSRNTRYVASGSAE